MKNQETDLAKAQRFAVPMEDFAKLLQGDLKSAINFLMALDHHTEVKHLLFEEMYTLYVKQMEAKSQEIEEDVELKLQENGSGNR